MYVDVCVYADERGKEIGGGGEGRERGRTLQCLWLVCMYVDVCVYADEREKEIGGGGEGRERERAEIAMLMAGMYVRTLMRGKRR